MKFNDFVIQADFKRAYEALKNGVDTDSGATIQTTAMNITAPAKLVQEQAFVNTQNQFTFEFGTAAPAASSTLNNVILGQNNAFIMTGLQILLGYGANANNRVLYSRGFTANDNSVFSGAQMSMNIESQTPIQKLDMLHFYEEGDFIDGAGFVPIKPLRVLTGLISKFQVQITFNNSISALTLSSNLFISVRPWGALGLA